MASIAAPTHGGGAAAMRAWDRRAHWTAHATLRWKVRVAGESAALPLRAARESLRAVRNFGRGVQAAHGVSRGQQWWQLWRLYVRFGLQAPSYYRFQLFRPERAARAAQYVDGTQYERVMRWHLARLPRGGRRAFVDKREFEAWCAEHGFPAARTLATLAPGGGAPPPATLPLADLFSKPADLAGGRGAARWRYLGPDRYAGADGAERTATELLTELGRQAAELARPVLVQECLRNHPDLTALTAGGLCTMRMVTIRPVGAEPELALAIYRMPVGDAAADNFDQGGLAAGVDVATGRLGPAMRKDATQLAARVERHPTTGAPIAGHPIPCWAEAVELVRRAHRAAAATVPIAGWDLAITDRGPVLVEANNVPGINLMQMPLDTPLGETPLIACLLEHLEATHGRRSGR